MVRFFRVAPGTEQSVAAQLSRRFANGVVCRAFGTHDFAVVEELPSWDEAQDPREGRGGLAARDILPTRCFPWEGYFDWDELQHSADSIVAFCFVKLSEEAIRNSGVEFETAIVKDLSRLARKFDVRAHMLGTMGWHEILVIVTASHMKEVLGYVQSIRSMPRGTLTKPAVDSTVTVMAVRSFPDVSETATMDGLDTFLRVACVPSADRSVKAALEEIFGIDDAQWCFGVSDFTIPVPALPTLAAYLRLLWDFRRDQRDNLLWTVTSFSGELSPAFPQVQPSQRHVASFQPTVGARRMGELRQNNSFLAELLVNTFRALDGYAKDRQVAADFVELLPYAKLLQRGFSHRVTPWQEDLVDNEDYLQMSLELLAYAIHQREAGTVSFWDREGPVYPDIAPYGATHRYLAAASSVVDAVLGSVDEEWQGFCVVGFHGDFLQYSDGVVNIPWGALDDIAWWLTLVHEVGHEYATRQNIINDPDLPGILEAASYYGDIGNELTLEVFCEAFACNFTVGPNRWREFFDRSWHYLRRHRSMRDRGASVQLFERFLLAELLVRFRHRPTLPTSASVTRAAKSISDRLRVICPTQPWNDEDLSSSIARCRLLVDEGFVEVLARHLPEGAKPRQSRLSRMLAEGRVPVHEVDPVDVILAVPAGLAGENWREGVSATLALWHIRKTSLGSQP